MSAQHDANFAEILRQNEQLALAMLSQAVGIPPEITPEDRLRAAIVEALHWLDENAPHRAHEALTKALNP